MYNPNTPKTPTYQRVLSAVLPFETFYNANEKVAIHLQTLH